MYGLSEVLSQSDKYQKHVVALRRIHTSLRWVRFNGLIQFLHQLFKGGDIFWIETVDILGIYRNANSAGTRVDAEWSLEQMVAVLRDFSIEARVGVLEDDVFEGCLHFRLLTSVLRF
jgi:hypothetical protein